MVAQKWAENYRLEIEEQREYERYLQTLYQPFPGLRSIQQARASVHAPRQIQDLTGYDNQFVGIMNKAAFMISKSFLLIFKGRFFTYI